MGGAAAARRRRARSGAAGAAALRRPRQRAHAPTMGAARSAAARALPRPPQWLRPAASPPVSAHLLLHWQPPVIDRGRYRSPRPPGASTSVPRPAAVSGAPRSELTPLMWSERDIHHLLSGLRGEPGPGRGWGATERGASAWRAGWGGDAITALKSMAATGTTIGQATNGGQAGGRPAAEVAPIISCSSSSSPRVVRAILNAVESS